jgi:large subunit ribosomal protein L4
MAQLKIRDAQGADAGTVDVSDAVFGIEPNTSAVRQALIAYEANQRQGTHSTKTRAFVSGGGKKPWKQKGTGRARQGSIRSPQWRGGAIIFGPQPRDYRQKTNKKVRRLALQSAFSDLRLQNRITVLKTFGLEQPKTKDFLGLLGRIDLAGPTRLLIMLSEPDDHVRKAARNLPNVVISSVRTVNIYDLLTCDQLVTTAEGIKALEEQFA